MVLTADQSNWWSHATNELRIGALTDHSVVYCDISRKGAITAVQMAVDDIGGSVNGRPIRVISADHQLMPDIGTAIATKWLDADCVSAIFNVVRSFVSLAVQFAVKQRSERALFATAVNPKSSGTTSM
jgi:branched-chain amino acid transport system substrate-binding protein